MYVANKDIFQFNVDVVGTTVNMGCKITISSLLTKGLACVLHGIHSICIVCDRINSAAI